MTALTDAIARVERHLNAPDAYFKHYYFQEADLHALIEAAKRAEAWEAVAMNERERCARGVEDDPRAALWAIEYHSAVRTIRALPAPTLPTGE